MSITRTVLEDAQDRAQKHRKVGCVRLSLKLLGFHPLNRGGAGIDPFHVHEVAHDAATNKVQLARYHQVDVVKVPQRFLDDWRAANRLKCQGNALMPAFSPTMVYATLTKTHFTHAMKLGAEGNRSLNNNNIVPLAYAENEEWVGIRDDGILCCVYSEDLWCDEPALRATMLGDNLNAFVQVGEDEMQAFGRVDAVVRALVAKASDPGTSSQAPSQQVELGVRNVYATLEEEGFGATPAPIMVDLIRFRLAITHKAAEIFRTCQQHSIGFRVQVKSDDYRLASTLGNRCSLGKVAILLFQYYNGLPANLRQNQRSASAGSASSSHFLGSSRFTAKKLNSKAVEELAREAKTTLAYESFVVAMFTHYKVAGRPANVDDGLLLEGRTQFFHSVGRSLMRVGQALCDLRLRNQLTKSITTPEECAETIEQAMAGSFAEAERVFREALIKANAFKPDTLPAWKHPSPETSQQPVSGTSEVDATSTFRLAANFGDGSGGGAGELHVDAAALTPAAVFRRLKIKGEGEMVYVRPGARLLKAPSQQGTVLADEPQQLVNTVTATLVALTLPSAEITIASADGATSLSYTVNVDELLAISAMPKTEAPPTPPALVDAKKATLSLPPFDCEALGVPWSRCAAQYALNWSFCLHAARTQTLTTLLLSEIGKLPYKFQVRLGGDVAMKKGELVLVPYGTSIVAKTETDKMGTLVRTEAIVHESLRAAAPLACVATEPVDARTKEAKRRKTESEPTYRQDYYVLSPLLQGKALSQRQQAYGNLAPYWAVPRCGRACAADNNMSLVEVGLEIPHLKGDYTTGVSKALLHSVIFTAMVNTKTVRPGDALCLPFLDA